MAYADQALLSRDVDFIDRLSASAAVEIDPVNGYPPDAWARANVWWIAAAPGFADAYASAIAGSVDRPGNDPSVISDAQILAAVQAFEAEHPPPGPPP